MSEGSFNLRKCISISPELLWRIKIAESVLDSVPKVPESQSQVTESYAKSTVGPLSRSSYTKLYGLSGENQTDNFLFDFTDLIEYARQLPPSKRSILKFDLWSFRTIKSVRNLLEGFVPSAVHNSAQLGWTFTGRNPRNNANTELTLLCPSRSPGVIFWLTPVRLMFSYMDIVMPPVRHMLL